MELLLLVMLLGAPALALFRAGRGPAMALAAGSTALGVAAGLISPLGLAVLAILFAAFWWSLHGPAPWAGALIFIPVAVALGFGLAPGFEPLVLAEPAVLKEGSAPYGLRLRIEKVLAGVALLLGFVRPVADLRASASALRRVAPLALATGATVCLLALLAGHVRPAPQLPGWEVTLPWMVINLLAVCTVEEGFFRGVVQERLGRSAPAGIAIATAALLFGLAHFDGGVVQVAVATVAGIGYGLVYHHAGRRIEAAVLAHFLVNAGHFALLTYPFAAS